MLALETCVLVTDLSPGFLAQGELPTFALTENLGVRGASGWPPGCRGWGRAFPKEDTALEVYSPGLSFRG